MKDNDYIKPINDLQRQNSKPTSLLRVIAELPLPIDIHKIKNVLPQITDKMWEEERKNFQTSRQLLESDGGKMIPILTMIGLMENRMEDVRHIFYKYNVRPQIPVEACLDFWNQLSDDEKRDSHHYLKDLTSAWSWNNHQPTLKTKNSDLKSFQKKCDLLKEIAKNIHSQSDYSLKSFLGGQYTYMIKEGIFLLSQKVSYEKIFEGLPENLDDGFLNKKISEASAYSAFKEFGLNVACVTNFSDFTKIVTHLSQYCGADETKIWSRFMKSLRLSLDDVFSSSQPTIEFLEELCKDPKDFLKQSDYKKIIRSFGVTLSDPPYKLEGFWQKLDEENQKSFAKSLVSQDPNLLDKIATFADEKIIVKALADFFQSKLERSPQCQRLWEKHILLEKLDGVIEAKLPERKKKM